MIYLSIAYIFSRNSHNDLCGLGFTVIPFFHLN